MAEVKHWILEGTKMMCPKCKGTEELSRNEYVATNVQIQVDENGNWEWTGTSKVHWDTSDYRPEQGELEWRCGTCDIDFSAPNVKSICEAEKNGLSIVAFDAGKEAAHG